MSRRSARQPAPGGGSFSLLTPSVRRGLESICDFDEDAVGKMIPIRATTETTAQTLAKVMSVNAISAEVLLARFFSRELLGPYCEQRLGKSGKGDAATLAARVAREWAKPNFRETRAGEATPAAAAPAVAAASAKPDAKSGSGGARKRQRSS